MNKQRLKVYKEIVYFQTKKEWLQSFLFFIKEEESLGYMLLVGFMLLFIRSKLF